MTSPLAADGRGMIVAPDRPLYSWPCRRLEQPRPASAIAEAVGCGVPVVLAGGDPREPAHALAQAADSMGAGAAGVAFGRNVRGADDPAAIVRTVHGAAAPAS